MDEETLQPTQPEPTPGAPTSAPAETPTPSAAAGIASKKVWIFAGIAIIVLAGGVFFIFGPGGEEGSIEKETAEQVLEGLGAEGVDLEKELEEAGPTQLADVRCGDALPLAFLESQLSQFGTVEYEDVDETSGFCSFSLEITDIDITAGIKGLLPPVSGNVVISEGTSWYNGFVSVRESPAYQEVRYEVTNNIGSQSTEYEGFSETLGKAVQLAIVTTNSQYSVGVTLIGDQSTIEIARDFVREIDKNLA